MAVEPYKTKLLGAERDSLKSATKLALELGEATSEAAKQFFERHFTPYRVKAPHTGFLTGFFEPEVIAVRAPDAEYCHPLYGRPDDLIDLRDHNRPNHIDTSYRFGWGRSDRIDIFHDRAAIDAGALNDQGLEIAWLSDRVDQFFVHVQGAARLLLKDDGTTSRVTYAAKSGHPYSSLAKILCERLELPPQQMTADRLAAWMRSNPDQLDDLLAENRSDIFFREVEGQTVGEGPIAAAECPLVAERSLAIDRTFHTFGTPIWIATRDPFVSSDKPLRRLTVAHDTGSAIVGPSRADIFMGSGEVAGFLAGKIRHEMEMITLLPRKR